MFSQKKIEDKNDPNIKSMRSVKSIAFKEKQDVIYQFPAPKEQPKKKSTKKT